MQYEIVTLEETCAVGVSARANNGDPGAGAVIGGLWPSISAGRYAKFVIRGDLQRAVAAAWQEIWQMHLPRSFRCDFEEYQEDRMEDTEIHIYVGLTEVEDEA